MSGITLPELEWSWFATRSGLSGSTTTLSDHKLTYLSNIGFGGANKPLVQMEKEWLQALSQNTSEYFGDLWRSACVYYGATVGATMNECKRNFFSLASPPWTTQYEAGVLPDADTPAWTKRQGTGATTEISPAGYFHLISDSDGITYDIGSNINASVGATMEVRMQVVSGDVMDYPTLANDSTSLELQLDTGPLTSTYFSIYTDGVLDQETGNSYSFDTTDTYHTYRVTVKGTTGKLYVDNVLRLTQTAVASGAGAGYGFWSGYEAFGGVETSWDYIYLSSNGSFIS